MKALIYFNTIVNILLIGWWIYRNNRIYISINRTDIDKKILGFTVMWNAYPVRKGVCDSGLFYVPIRNAEKLETRESVIRLINSSQQNRTQQLQAIFSWLKTNGEVRKFKRDYLIVDENLVLKLVNDFKEEN